jgi:hypothetical protein
VCEIHNPDQLNVNHSEKSGLDECWKREWPPEALADLPQGSLFIHCPDLITPQQAFALKWYSQWLTFGASMMAMSAA